MSISPFIYEKKGRCYTLMQELSQDTNSTPWLEASPNIHQGVYPLPHQSYFHIYAEELSHK